MDGKMHVKNVKVRANNSEVYLILCLCQWIQVSSRPNQQMPENVSVVFQIVEMETRRQRSPGRIHVSSSGGLQRMNESACVDNFNFGSFD